MQISRSNSIILATIALARRAHIGYNDTQIVKNGIHIYVLNL
jgi:hypothetical protein